MTEGESLVSFDLDRALELARSTTDDAVLVVAEVTGSDYRHVHVADTVEQRFATADVDLQDVADSFHTYEAIDFFEREAFDDLIPTVGSVRALVTFAERAIIVRVLAPEEGVYVSVEPDTDVTALVRALESVVNGEEPPDGYADEG